jgi:hypothetical protein
MAVTQNTYSANGSTVLYSFTFPYLENTDIKVSLDGVITTAYTLANATTIQFTTAPTAGVAVRIFRETDDSDLAATFYPGSAIRSQDLNENFTQNLYVTQESNREAELANQKADFTATVAAGAVTTANSAVSTANAATATANGASSAASAAVTTANTASTNASAAVTTANTASTNATAAVNTANSAATDAATAISTANGAVSTANAATATANTASATATTASTNASAAVTTANTATTTAGNAVTTANNAVTTANSAVTTAGNAVTTANNTVTTANSAVTTANSAVTTANAAASAVANAILYDTVANVAAIPATPANNDAVEVVNSTGIQSFTPLNGIPGGFVGSSGLSVRIVFTAAGNTWSWIQYFPNDPESRYLKLSGGTVTGEILIGSAGSLVFEGATDDSFETTLAVADATADRTLTLPNVTGTLVSTGDTGTVTSTMIADDTIVNADINASAAIVDTKLATIATGGKVSNSATTATDANTASAIVARDASGNFTAGTITAALTGAASSNVLKAGDTMTGALVVPLASAATPSLTFTGDLNTGIYSPGADQVAVSTGGLQRINIEADGDINIDGGGVFYDATNNRLAIGTTSPQAILSVSDGTVTGEINPFSASSTCFIGTRTDHSVSFQINASEKARIDTSGRLLIGTSTSLDTSYGTPGGYLQVNNAPLPVILAAYTNDIYGGRLDFVKSRSTTVNGKTIVQNNDALGGVIWGGADGTNIIPAAAIGCEVDGTPNANVMPGRLVFSTTASGASSPTARMIITSTGDVILANQADLRFREATANGTNYVGFQAPATIAADVLWTLPATDGTAGQALVTNGSTTLEWATAAAGGVSIAKAFFFSGF